MYILDTCILNILFFYPGAKREAVTRELNTVDRSDLYISAISVYELIGGAISEINRTLNSRDVVLNLAALTKLIDKLSNFRVLQFTEEDYRRFEAISAAIKRRGSLDARIAASALSRNYVVVTEDDEVFELAGARHIDWTRPPT